MMHPRPSQEQGAGLPRKGVHLFPVRVYYEDTDAVGVVYHTSYLRFAERARTEMLRAAGLQQSELWGENGIGFVVRRCAVHFLARARLDDHLQVATRLLDLRGASLDLGQDIRRDGSDLVRLRVKLACMRTDGRAARLPEQVRAAFVEFLSNNWPNDGQHRG